MRGTEVLSFDLGGRTALVTGSTSGIGLAIAHALVSAGARVLIHGHGDQAEIDRVAGELSSEGRAAAGTRVDLAARDGGRSLAAWALSQGDIDILVLSAAVQRRMPWTALDDEQFDWHVDVNLRSTLQLLQALAPPMQRRGFGRIVTIGSVQQTRPDPDLLVYAATKAALRSIVRNLARQLGPSGVTVNNIAPGAIATPRNDDWMHDPAQLAEVKRRIPLGRLGDAAECAGMAVLLCSPAGAYITGADLYVDGGMDVQ
jgi:NAD(P)-dependent dehydrogenase (short-subunit alcohol dehydrogenase family)